MDNKISVKIEDICRLKQKMFEARAECGRLRDALCSLMSELDGIAVQTSLGEDEARTPDNGQDRPERRKLAGQVVCVTGTLPGVCRKTVHAVLTAAGAEVVSSVTRKTTMLLTGDNGSANKVGAAISKGIAVKGLLEIGIDFRSVPPSSVGVLPSGMLEISSDAAGDDECFDLCDAADNAEADGESVTIIEGGPKEFAAFGRLPPCCGCDANFGSVAAHLPHIKLRAAWTRGRDELSSIYVKGLRSEAEAERFAELTGLRSDFDDTNLDRWQYFEDE